MRLVGSVVGRVGAFVGACALLSGVMLSVSTEAEARSRHGYHRSGHHAVRHAANRIHHAHYRIRPASRHATASVSRGGYLTPSYASIIVDANTGRTLSATNESVPHHPASVTKVMTLYLLFEQLEKGKLTLESEIPISAHAASQAPSKLGLRPGSTIDVEDAIKAIVTKSANDIATAVAEAVGGDEETFAEMMTRRARSLGMNGTTYRNASGLPNPQQITTARDLAILGRAIQDRFPRYYRYFATRSFYYAGRSHPNHNHLLGRVEGMDGIKTGYTAASGFNLLTSVKRDGRYIIGVVLGGRSGHHRDTIMAGLIEDNLSGASSRRTAVAVTEQDAETVRSSSRIMESAPEDVEVTPRRPARVAVVEPRVEPKADPVPEAPIAQVAPQPRRPANTLDLSVPSSGKLANRVDDKPRPAFVTATQAETQTSDTKPGRAGRRMSAESPVTRPMAYAAAPSSATPSSLRWVEGAQGRSDTRAAANRTEVARSDAKIADAKAAEAKTSAGVALVRPVHTGWMIQIGATEDAEKAHDLLTRAKAKAGLVSAKAFTEKVQKGSETLWRARFAGLEEDSAESACRALKRSGFSCFATRN